MTYAQRLALPLRPQPGSHIYNDSLVFCIVNNRHVCLCCVFLGAESENLKSLDPRNAWDRTKQKMTETSAMVYIAAFMAQLLEIVRMVL